MTSYLGIDLGTQGVKVVVYDADSARIVARGAHGLDLLDVNRPGAAEQDPDCWWRAFESAMDQALAACGEAKDRISAIGVSGQQHGMVAVDEHLQVIRPAKLWCDTETVNEAEELSEQLRRPIPAGFTAPKILWMKRNEPHNFDRMRHLLLPHDWLNLQLTGQLVTDHGDASGSGVYDPISRGYDIRGAQAIDSRVPEMLPKLLDAREWAGQLLPGIATRFGLPVGIRVSPGSGDNMMSALGAGAVRDGLMVVSLGTSGTLFGYSSKPIVDPTGAVAPFCDSTGGWLPLVCTQNCTTVVEEVRQGTDLQHDELSAMAADVEAGCGGLLFLPYLTGERTPNWPRSSGVLHGIRPGSLSPGTLYRAAMEGASFALWQGLEHLAVNGLAADEVRLVGGGANNRLWQQVLADMLQLQLSVSVELESAALGAAFQACWLDSGRNAAELYSDLARTEDAQVISPCAGNGQVYAERFDHYKSLGQQLFD